MTYRVIDVPQQSPEWFQARCGRLTASCAHKMLARIKTGEAAERRDLKLRLVVERLTGQPQEDVFVSPDMKRGSELEADARLAYESLTGNVAREVGFLAHPDLLAGGSPDGVIGNFEGLVELKVPRSATHLRYLRSKALPAEHTAQVTALLWLSGVPFCDFFSWDPRFPPELQTFHVRVKREDVDLAAFELALRLFLSEVDQELEAVRGLVLTTA